MSQTNENEMEVQTSSNIISTKAPKAVAKGKKPEGWQIDLPNPFDGMSLQDAVDKFGLENVTATFLSKAKIDFQAKVRTLAERGETDDYIADYMSEWKLGDKLEAVKLTPEQQISRNFSSMSPEEQAKVIAALTAMQKSE